MPLHEYPGAVRTGYLGDIGVPPVPDPMDFSAWFEVLLEGGWYTFDAPHNKPRIGRILIARGRDAADVACRPASVQPCWPSSRSSPKSNRKWRALPRTSRRGALLGELVVFAQEGLAA